MNSKVLFTNLTVFNLGKPFCSRCTGLENKIVASNWVKNDEIKHYKENNRKCSEAIRKLMEEKRNLKGEIEVLSTKVGDITKQYEEVKDKYDNLSEMATIESTEKNPLTKELNKTLSIRGTLQKNFEGSKYHRYN